VESKSLVPYLGRTLLRRLGEAALTLLVIAYLTILGLLLAERGAVACPRNRSRRPARRWSAWPITCFITPVLTCGSTRSGRLLRWC